MNIFKKIFFLLVVLFLIAGCGGATEVGNPIIDSPATQKVAGVIDLSTLPTDVTQDVSAAINPADLYVLAVSDDGMTFEAELKEDASFELGLMVDKFYGMYVLDNSSLIGEFSFEQDSRGRRANRIEIKKRLSPIDLGLIKFEKGVFIPENEPWRQMGWQ
jgi:hypothetical protein